MKAKELMPGMCVKTTRWGICTVLDTYQSGKWLKILLRSPIGSECEWRKFPNSLVNTIAAWDSLAHHGGNDA